MEDPTSSAVLAADRMGTFSRAHDWSASSIGAPEVWPQPLKTLVGVVLAAKQPMFIVWGPGRSLLYNDSYARTLGRRHPAAMGQPFLAVWPELRDELTPLFDRVFAGEPVDIDPLARAPRGVAEELHSPFSCTPVPDERGTIVGLFCVSTVPSGGMLVEKAERRMQAALRDSEARWRGLFERMGEAFFLAEAVRDAAGRVGDFRFLEINPAFERQTGLAAADTVGRMVRQAVPGVPDRLIETYARVVDTGEPAAFEVFVSSLGDRWYEARARKEGADRVAVLFLDITARKTADAAAREREAELRLVADALPVLMAFVDKTLTYRLANRTYEQWFGLKPEEIVGRTVIDVVGSLGYELRRPFMERALAGEAVLFEANWPYNDGRTRMVDIRYLPRRDEAGEIDGFYAFVIDITERKRSEQTLSEANAALAASEDLLRRAQAAGRIGTFETDLVRNEVKGSDEFWRVYGLEPAPVRSAVEIERLIDPHDGFSPPDEESRRAGREARTVEYRIRRADTGEVRWIARGADYLSASDGVPLKLIGTVQDVTDRRRATEDLRRSEELLRAFMDAMPNQVWTSPPDGQLDWFNEQVFRYSGRSAAELSGTGWTAMVHPEDLPRAAERWERSMRDGAVYETEFRLRRSDGLFRWHIARATPIRGSDGALTRWIGTNTDIEDQKASAAALRQLNETLEAQVALRTAERDRVWQNSRDLLVIVGADGIFRAVNPAWSAILGHDPAEVVGRSFLEFVWADDVDLTQHGLDAATQNDLTNFENRYRHKDGTPRWISWHTSAEGSVVYAYGRHITAEKEQAKALRHAEEQLRQSQKMEAVGQLTGGLAHDFNNLLTGIIGSLELLQARVNQGRINDLERYIVAAQGASKRAAALTHRLLAFSRRQTLSPEPTNINRLVAGMEELIRRTVGPEIEVEVVGAAGLWSALVDPNQLENALLNLCINARDAMPGGGRLTVETGNRWLDQRLARERELLPGQYVSLCVSDTGTGMSPDVVARAFDPFFTTKPLGMGTGLGLSMIYGFAKQSGGQVRIYSELGQGTMVCIYLPRHHGGESGADERVDPAPAPRAEQGETVLVVDDEPTVRMLVTEILEDLGYTAIEAADGASGLKILRSDARIDLLVTDVGLPGGMNGRQVADAGRAARPGLKVLFITGYAENAVVGNGHLEHGMEVLTKPFAMDDLANRIKMLISMK